MKRKYVLIPALVVLLAGAIVVSTTPPTVLAAPLADTDEDGLMNARETLHRTNATNSDTDNDGFPDGVEVKLEEPIPGSTPLRKDIYVELDYTSACGLSKKQVGEIVQIFERAPVENPDGSRGIDLHVKNDDRINETLGDGAGFFRISENFDHPLRGHHYLVGTIEDGTNHGTTSVFHCGQPGVFTHELGHSLGLERYRGIDSYYVSADQYPSTMNYNVPAGFLNYSDGSHGKNDYDDWEFIENKMTTPPVTRLCERVGATSHDCDRGLPVET